jgi:hypothetical protein
MQTFFDTQFPAGYPGMPADLGTKYDRSYINTASDLAGVITVTVATFAANTEYSLVINGTTVSHLTPATGGSAALTRDALVTAVNQSFAGVDATAGSGNTFLITGQSGQPLSVVPGSAALTQVVTTAPASSGDIGLGLAVIRLPGDSDREIRLGAPNFTHRFVGVTVDDGLRTNAYPYAKKDSCYRRGDVVLVREVGTLWVALDAPVTPDSPVFYRYSGAGKIGAFRGATAVGADMRLMNARFLTGGSDIAQLLLGNSSLATLED